MIRITTLLTCIFFLAACNDVDTVLGTNDDSKKDATSYSYACLDSAVANNPTGQRVEKVTGILRNLAVSKKSITDSVQTAWGADFHADVLEQGAMKLMNDQALDTRLTKVMNDLLAQRSHPSAIRYFIYAVDDTAINAFTFGGRIYVTKAMINQCKGNDALLYAIIGHEIGHSEAGHIKATIQDMEVAEKYFGDGSDTYLQLKSLLTASFNQKNELEADYYGINLTNKMGFDLCTVVQFWKEMANKENSYNKVEDFFRTHPFSQSRAQCLADHIKTNFGKDCGTIKASEIHPKTHE
jgi:predicted Zn-dependent protease